MSKIPVVHANNDAEWHRLTTAHGNGKIDRLGSYDKLDTVKYHAGHEVVVGRNTLPGASGDAQIGYLRYGSRVIGSVANVPLKRR